MSEIVVTHEQTRVLAGASSAIPIRDPNGKLIGYASPNVPQQDSKVVFTPEQIAELEKRLDSDGPWSTTREMLHRLADCPGPAPRTKR
jgi:hypothetical protein